MKQTNTVKFFYLRDTKEPQRVLTVARSLKKGKNSTKVLVGWAVSRPTQKDEWNEVVVDGDQFRKDRGRQIATGRMVKAPIKAKLGEDETPNWVAMKALAGFKGTRTNEYGEEVDIVPRQVRRMAKEYIARPQGKLMDSLGQTGTNLSKNEKAMLDGKAVPGTDRAFRNFLKKERQLKNKYPAELILGEEQALENEVPENYTSESE